MEGTSSEGLPWWVWSEEEPRAFARLWRFVDAQAVHEAFHTPGFGPEPPARRLVRVLDRLAALGIAYRSEPPVYPGTAGQALRDPAQVLRTREATCLEVALVAAGACVRSALACWIVGGTDEAMGVRHVWLVVDVEVDHGVVLDHDPHVDDIAAWERARGAAGAVEDGRELARRVASDPTRLLVIDPTRLCDGAGWGTGSADPERRPDASEGSVAIVEDGVGYLGRFTDLQVADVGAWWSPGMLVPRPGAKSNPAAALRPIWPDATPIPGAMPPPLSTLLRADRRVVAFQVSDTSTHVVTEVERWSARLDASTVPAAGMAQVALVVVLGGGGTGKTRLALEAVETWTGEDATLGRGAVRGVVSGDTPAQDVAAVVGEPGLVVLVLDYADAAPSAVVGELLRVLAARPPGWGRVVLVATGREEGSWLSMLRRAVSPVVECDLSDDADGSAPTDRDQAELFRRGAEAVAAVQRQPVRAVVPEADALRGATPLEVLLRAGLAQVSQVDPGSGERIYRAALDHERSYWAQHLHRVRVEAGAEGASRPLSAREEGHLDLLVAMVSLSRPRPADLDELVSDVAGSGDDAVHLAEVLRRLYPGETTGAWDRVGGLRPDPLADTLIRSALPGDDAEPGDLTWDRLLRSAGPDGWEALVAALDRAYASGPPPAWLSVGLRAALSDDHRAPAVVAAGVRGGAGPAYRALVAELMAGDAPPIVVDAISQDPTLQVARLAAALPAGPAREAEPLAMARVVLASRTFGVELSDAGADLVESALDELRAQVADGDGGLREELAEMLLAQARFFDSKGQPGRAVDVVLESMAIWSALVDEGCDDGRAARAKVRIVLGVHLAHDGCWDDAITQTETAVAELRDLIDAGGQEHRFDLAMASANLSNDLTEVGRGREAVAPALDAVGIVQGLVDEGLLGFRAPLADVTTTLAGALWRTGRLAEACEVSGQALAIHREVVDKRRDGRAKVARAAATHAVLLGDLGRVEEAIEIAKEAVDTLHELVDAGREELRGDLLTAMNTLGARLAAVGRKTEAVPIQRQAVEVLRGLSPTGHRLQRRDLGVALMNLGTMLNEGGDVLEAVAPAQEAVEILREVEADDLAARPLLASALVNLGVHLAEAGRVAEGVAPVEEAVAIRRQIVADDQLELRPELARSLVNLGNRLSAVGRERDAIALEVEGVEIFRGLIGEGRMDLRDDLARGLVNLSGRLAGGGRVGEAVACVEEAVAVRQALVDEGRVDLRGSLAYALTALGQYQRGVGREVEALASGQQAIGLLRALVEEGRAELRPDLARTLGSHARDLVNVGQVRHALASATESVAIYRDLVGTGREDLRADLASSLMNLGGHLGELTQRAEAVEATVESVAILERLLDEGRSDLRPEYAMALGISAGRLFAADRPWDALGPAEASVALHRELLAEGQTQLRDRATRPLLVLGRVLMSMGRDDEAVPVLGEAVDLLRELRIEHALDDPRTLALVLLQLGGLLGDLGRSPEALGPTEEAVELYLAMVATVSSRDAPSLVFALESLGARLAEIGRADDVFPWWRRAVERTEGVGRSIVQVGQARALADLWHHAEAGDVLVQLGSRYIEVATATERTLLRSAHAAALEVAGTLPGGAELLSEYRLPSEELRAGLEGWADARGTEQEIAFVAILGEIRPSILLPACDHLVFVRPGEGLDDAVDRTFGRVAEIGVEAVVAELTVAASQRRWVRALEIAVAAGDRETLEALLGDADVSTHSTYLVDRTAPEAAIGRALVRRARDGRSAVALAMLGVPAPVARSHVVRALGAGRVDDAADLVAIRPEVWTDAEVAVVEQALELVGSTRDGVHTAGGEDTGGSDPLRDVRPILRHALRHASEHHPVLDRLWVGPGEDDPS